MSACKKKRPIRVSFKKVARLFCVVQSRDNERHQGKGDHRYYNTDYRVQDSIFRSGNSLGITTRSYVTEAADDEVNYRDGADEKN